MTPKEALSEIQGTTETDWGFGFDEDDRYPIEHNLFSDSDERFKIIYQALNEFERLKEFKKTFDKYELAKKQDFIAYENWQECEAFIAKTIAILKSRIGLNLHIIESEPISKQDKNNLLAENIGIEFAIMLLEDTD